MFLPRLGRGMLWFFVSQDDDAAVDQAHWLTDPAALAASVDITCWLHEPTSHRRYNAVRPVTRIAEPSGPSTYVRILGSRFAPRSLRGQARTYVRMIGSKIPCMSWHFCVRVLGTCVRALFVHLRVRWFAHTYTCYGRHEFHLTRSSPLAGGSCWAASKPCARWRVRTRRG